MRFRYSAITKGKRKKRGEIEAASRSVAARRLKAQGLVVTAVEPISEAKKYYIGGVPAIQKVMMTKHLAVMLRAGISLDAGLRILELQTKGQLQHILKQVREEVEEGNELADALEKYPNVFNDYYVNMIRAGETSGNLEQNLELLGEHFRKDHEIKKKAKAAMLYPSIVLGLTLGLLVLIALFILPRLSQLFKSFHAELPLSTRIVIALSDFSREYGLLTAGILFFVLIAIIIIARQRFAAPFFHPLYTKIPIVSRIVETVNLARFATVFGSLLESGLTITKSLMVTSNVIGNVAYQKGIHDAVKRLDRGESLADSLRTHKLYPPFVVEMVEIGERTGKLEHVMGYIGEYYEQELDSILKNLTSIIEPVLLVIIGLIVAGIALSVITPIYNFIGAVG